MSATFRTEDEFGTPSKIPQTSDQLDLRVFDKNSKQHSQVDASLRLKSLYQKFDPLLHSPAKSTDTEAFAVSAGSTSPDRASIVQRAQALLASERKSQSPQKVAAVMFTEEEKDAAVREAVAQAEEEALIVQMETEDLRRQLATEREQNTQMTAVMEEYSAEITNLMKSKTSAMEGDSAKVQKLAMEKEQVERDLEKTETAFSDLHAKYVKVKEVLENYKKNEATLKDALQKGQLAVNVSESRYAKLRAHAEEKIEEANKEIAGVRDQYASKITALEMKVKAQDREILSLKREVDIKIQDNAELTAICDELVKKLEG